KMSECKPVSFQGDNIVASDFEKHSNVVGFKVDGYDKGKVLVIDPTLIWGTYFGGSNLETGNGVVIDSRGYVYMIGTTYSNSGVATSGAFQSNQMSSPNSFLAKFTSTGQIQWATYYASYQCGASGVCTDKTDNVYIVG